jgi:hypothetical protein
MLSRGDLLRIAMTPRSSRSSAVSEVGSQAIPRDRTYAIRRPPRVRVDIGNKAARARAEHAPSTAHRDAVRHGVAYTRRRAALRFARRASATIYRSSSATGDGLIPMTPPKLATRPASGSLTRAGLQTLYGASQHLVFAMCPAFETRISCPSARTEPRREHPVPIVDDEPLSRRRVASLLRTVSDAVVGACKGQRCCGGDRRARAPTSCFSDVQIPGDRWVGVLASVAHDRMPEVIFVTARQVRAQGIRGARAGLSPQAVRPTACSTPIESARRAHPTEPNG